MDTSTASQISIITFNDKFMDMRQKFLCADFELLRKVNFDTNKYMQHNCISVRSIYVDKSNHRKKMLACGDIGIDINVDGF